MKTEVFRKERVYLQCYSHYLLSYFFKLKTYAFFFKESKLMIAFRIKINASLTSSMTVQMWGEKKQNKRSVFPSLH